MLPLVSVIAVLFFEQVDKEYYQECMAKNYLQSSIEFDFVYTFESSNFGSAFQGIKDVQIRQTSIKRLEKEAFFVESEQLIPDIENAIVFDSTLSFWAGLLPVKRWVPDILLFEEYSYADSFFDEVNGLRRGERAKGTANLKYSLPEGKGIVDIPVVIYFKGCSSLLTREGRRDVGWFEVFVPNAAQIMDDPTSINVVGQSVAIDKVYSWPLQYGDGQMGKASMKVIEIK